MNWSPCGWLSFNTADASFKLINQRIANAARYFSKNVQLRLRNPALLRHKDEHSSLISCPCLIDHIFYLKNNGRTILVFSKSIFG